MSYDYSENILVQESAGNLLRDELGWDVRFAYNTEILGKNGTFGRESYKEIVLLRYFREALKKLNPWINDSQISEAQKTLEQRLSTSSLLQVNEEKYFLIRDGIPVTVKKPNGQMVVVCPGGGYVYVSTYNEGVYVADWLVSQGITVAVAKYRMPNRHWEVPLSDIHHIFRYCREHAEEWGVKQIGVMGFSAGGHLAASATTLYTDDETKPDFSILVYPVTAFDKTPSHKGTRLNLIGPDEIWTSPEGKSAEKWLADQRLHAHLVYKYTLGNGVNTDTPPVFLAHCTDDTTVPVINSIVFYNRLVECGISAEMHIYPSGGHGWGFSSEKYVEKDRFGYARPEFEASLARWLESQRNY